MSEETAINVSSMQQRLHHETRGVETGERQFHKPEDTFRVVEYRTDLVTATLFHSQHR